MSDNFLANSSKSSSLSTSPSPSKSLLPLAKSFKSFAKSVNGVLYSAPPAFLINLAKSSFRVGHSSPSSSTPCLTWAKKCFIASLELIDLNLPVSGSLPYPRFFGDFSSMLTTSSSSRVSGSGGADPLVTL